MSTGPSSKSSYELELAIDVNNERDAINKLSQIFGPEITTEIDPAKFTKRSDLFFINHRFSNEQLSDENYMKLLKDSKMLVVSDRLSIKRASKLLEYCFPVEVQLKKLLTYVYPSIVEVFDGKTDRKSRIKLCKQINSWNLGDLLDRLEFDISSKRREEIFFKDGKALEDILNKSMTFDDFKKMITPQIRKNTVWDQVCVVLEKPVEYEVVKDDLHQLRYLRNKAAHPQVILASDLNIAKERAETVMRHISSDVKGDYRNELLKSIKSLEQMLSEVTRTYTSEIQKTMDSCLHIPENVKKITEDIKAINPAIAIKNIDWLALDSEMRRSNPEPKEATKQLDISSGNGAITSKERRRADQNRTR